MTDDRQRESTANESETETTAMASIDAEDERQGGTASELTIVATDEARRDQRIPIRVAGAAAGASVSIDARLTDPYGVEWESNATFTADSDGVVDPTEHAPDSGTYEGVEPMGWLWSMTAADDATVTGLRRAARTSIALTASTDTERARGVITQRLVDPGVERRPVASESVAGTLFVPPGAGPHPGVIALHGSGGERPDDVAALLAARGFATLALQYFGESDPVPDELTMVPLSYFDAAASWLRNCDCVRDDRLGVIGMSRGGELALLLGARSDWVGAVVSYVGSGVAYNTRHGPSAWAEDGEPVPHVRATDEHAHPEDDGTTAMLERALDDADEETLRAATITVEETDGPVLLISGGRDPVWPSQRLLGIAAGRLRDSDFDHAFEHLAYEEAGHYVTPPFLPKTDRVFGGTPAAMAHADVGAWPTAIDYLERGLCDGAGHDDRSEGTHD